MIQFDCKKIMNQAKVLKTANFAKEFFKGDFSGHDWWHTFRVWNLAKNIAKREKADIFVVEMAALLHDVADEKLNNGSASVGKKKVINWLKSLDVNEENIAKIWSVIMSVSFKGATTKNTAKNIEAMIVQDADRLDAIGAIGIARAFAFGGTIKRDIYNPSIKPIIHKNYKEYKKREGTSINHFYEKLHLLKDRMNTSSAKKIAQKRHDYLLSFLEEFFIEWEGKD